MNNLSEFRSLVNSHDGKRCKLSVYVIPNSNKSEIGTVDLWRKSLKVNLVSEPVGGRANSELHKLFTKFLNLSDDSISIISGLKYRRKTILINLSEELLISKFKAKIGFD